MAFAADRALAAGLPLARIARTEGIEHAFLLTALSLAMLLARGGHLQASQFGAVRFRRAAHRIQCCLGDVPLLFGTAEWKNRSAEGRVSGALVLRGAAFSVVPMLVFGSLLMAADAVFQNLIHRIFRFDFTHLVVIGFVFWWVGGYLRGLLLGKELSLGTAEVVLPFSLGATEIGVMLGLLDLLFAAFVAVQVRYFFGGSALVHATTGLTYAEYARRGFFQLLTVAALLLPFLLMVHWLLRPDDASRAAAFYRAGRSTDRAAFRHHGISLPAHVAVPGGIWAE